MTVEHPVVPGSELELQTGRGKSEGFRTNRKDPSGRPEVHNSPTRPSPGRQEKELWSLLQQHTPE